MIFLEDRVKNTKITVSKYPSIHIVSKEKLPLLSSGFICENGFFGFCNTLLTTEGWIPFDRFWVESRYDFLFCDIKRSQLKNVDVDYMIDLYLKLYAIETVDGRYGLFSGKATVYGEMGWIKVSNLVKGDSLFCVSVGEDDGS